MRPDDVDPVGATGIMVTRLGLGTAWLGNMYTPVEAASAAAVVRQALGLGIRLIDTAPLYGYGLAEQRLGEALVGVRREDFALCTKVGRLLRPRLPGEQVRPNFDGTGPLFVDAPDLYADFDFSHDATLRCIDQSLRRLGLDRLDIVLIHDPDEHVEQALAGAYRTLVRLREDNVIGAIGVGSNRAHVLTRFVRAADLDVVLLAGEYTLLDQSGLDELLPACRAAGTSVVVGGVYNTGVLADPTPGACYKYQVAPAEILERARHIQTVCARYDVPLRAAAIQFPFGHPAVSSVLAGVRSVEELVDNVAMLTHPVPADMWADLRQEGLLPQHVPAPDTTDQAG
jgi:D-threo-aldose 1-dehydrogenase